MSPDSPIAAWRLMSSTVGFVNKHTGESRTRPGNGFLRGLPLSPEVSKKRMGTNPHPRVSLARAIYEVGREKIED